MSEQDRMASRDLSPAFSGVARRRVRRQGALRLFTRTNSKGLYNIATYHSPHSLTWSWIVSINFDGIWRGFDVSKGRRSIWPRFGFHLWGNNHGPQWSVALPGVVLSRQVQSPTWYRDLFYRAREREDALEDGNRKLRRELAKTRATAMAGLASGRPQ